MLRLTRQFDPLRLLRSAGIFLLLASVASASADLKVVSQMQMSVNGDYRPMEFATIYYKGDWLRVDTKNKTLISNSATHKTFELDHASKTYFAQDTDLADEASEGMKMLKP